MAVCRNVGIALVALIAAGLLGIDQMPSTRSLPLFNMFRAPGFTYDQMPDLTGKVIIVTGGNTGLGKASVAPFFEHNAHVILTSRDVSRGEAAKADIIEKAKAAGVASKGKIDVMELDLASLASVRKFAAAFLAKKVPLHVLMLNAGIAAVPYALTKDGIESQFGVNHVAHQLLTDLLLPVLKSTHTLAYPARIVSVSSASHRKAPKYGVGTTLETINNQTIYDPFVAYGQSKLANILFTLELADRLKDTGILVNSLHPGAVATEIPRYALANKIVSDYTVMLAPYFYKYVAYTPEVAAVTQVYAAVGPEMKLTGEYFVPLAILEKNYSHPLARDVELRKKVWKFTEELIAAKRS